VSVYDEICFHGTLLRAGFPVTFVGTGYEIPVTIRALSEGGKRSLGLHRVGEIFMIQESRRHPMKDEDESDVGVRGQTGELYMLDKKED
jgi:hypothetical protein